MAANENTNETTILNMTEEQLSNVRATGFIPVSVSGRTVKLALKNLGPVIPNPPATGTYFLISNNGTCSWVATDVTSILKVAELPATKVDTTLYAVVEEA